MTLETTGKWTLSKPSTDEWRIFKRGSHHAITFERSGRAFIMGCENILVDHAEEARELAALFAKMSEELPASKPERGARKWPLLRDDSARGGVFKWATSNVGANIVVSICPSGGYSLRCSGQICERRDLQEISMLLEFHGSRSDEILTLVRRSHTY